MNALYLSSVSLSTDSGVGAGIDSYYEYLMKAYILLGDNVYLERFNTVSSSPVHQAFAEDTYTHHAQKDVISTRFSVQPCANLLLLKCNSVMYVINSGGYISICEIKPVCFLCVCVCVCARYSTTAPS